MLLDRLITIMELVAVAGRPVSAADIQKATGLPKPTCYRLVQTLLDQGMIDSPADGMRCLRPIEIFGAHMLTGIWQLRARARQGVPDELVCEDVSVV